MAAKAVVAQYFAVNKILVAVYTIVFQAHVLVVATAIFPFICHFSYHCHPHLRRLLDRDIATPPMLQTYMKCFWVQIKDRLNSV